MPQGLSSVYPYDSAAHLLRLSSKFHHHHSKSQRAELIKHKTTQLTSSRFACFLRVSAIEPEPKETEDMDEDVLNLGGSGEAARSGNGTGDATRLSGE